jgi:LPXTG-motif cell wall-anchored protein
MKKWMLNALIIVFALVFVGSAGYLAFYFINLNKTEKDYNQLANMVQQAQTGKMELTNPTKPEGNGGTVEPGPILVPVEKNNGEIVEILYDYAEIYKLNNEMVGWITIPGTNINYPVVQSSVYNKDFYLYRNFANTDGTTTKKYAHVNAEGIITEWSTDKPSTPLVSGEDGTFVIKGLDSLAYHLEEIKAPDGYNKMGDKEFTIDSTMTLAGVTELKGELNKDLATLTFSDTIENKSGAVLPETGAMGTMWLILGSAMLVIVAGVFMITRKKMSIYED